MQLITLHLALHRRDSSDQFAPFIFSLPNEFNGHPLSWVTNDHTSTLKSNICHELLKLLPAGCLWQLRKIETRFWEDIEALRLYLVCIHYLYKHRSRDNHLSGLLQTQRSRVPYLPWADLSKEEEIADYVWAWLNGKAPR